ncbi:major capsid protein [Priestia aryabhattai]|uniref:major capsid protein n=1 Tax=Priestia aryabhattai TaxID=412384 RepID=UPI0035ABA880
MSGITHLEQFQKPALKRLVDLTEKDVDTTIADAFLPTVTTFNRRFMYDIVTTNSYLASYIGYGSEPPVVDRDAVASKGGEIAYFGLKDILTYEELQSIHEARNNAEKAATIAAITQRNIKLLNGLRDLVFLAKMEALTKGKLEYTTGKNKITFDFGIPAENKVALTDGADFDTTTFDIIGFLLEQQQKYIDANGEAPEVMWMSREVQAKLLVNAGIITVAGAPTGVNRASVQQLDDVLNQYGLPPIKIIDRRSKRYKDLASDNFIEREFMPVNRIVFLSRGVGEYLLGPTLENNFQPGFYLEAYDKKEPVQSILRAVGAGFPAPSDPKKIMHLDVYTP